MDLSFKQNNAKFGGFPIIYSEHYGWEYESRDWEWFR